MKLKSIVIVLFFALFLSACSSVKKHNAHLNDLIPAELLQKDVDLAYQKLQQLRPKLYWYCPKEQLDFKFDSLKKTIQTPLTSFEFFRKLSPVVTNVRQGHLFISPPLKKMTARENKAFIKRGFGPLSQFDFELFDNKLYVLKNKSNNKNIKPGTEVVALDGKNPTDLIKEYQRWFASDGYNQTFKKNFLGRRFSSFYTFEHGIKDSIIYKFKRNDSIQTVTIKRSKIDSTAIKKEIKKEITAAEKAKLKNKKQNQIKYGYDEIAKQNNRSLTFLAEDSLVAVIKIRSFTKGNYGVFYEDCFKKIAKRKAKALILDLRDNGGGRLSEVAELYSYLADSSFVFMNKSLLTSKTSLLHTDYFKGGGVFSKMGKILLSPFFYGFSYFSVSKGDDGNYYYETDTKPQELSENNFSGKIYVLINGGSFSASSIISSNLKSVKRVTFVGEETGGAFNGTVAGSMPVIELPNSKVNMRLGLMTCVPHNLSKVEGRGIFPDIEIIPTLQDRMNNIDPEMNWVKKDIKKDQEVNDLVNKKLNENKTLP